MLLFILAIVGLVGAAASLWGSYLDWRDIRTGKPSFETLVSYTGVSDREEFVRLLGPADQEDRFSVPGHLIPRLPVSLWARTLDSAATDVLCIVTALSAIAFRDQRPAVAMCLAIAAAGIQTAGYLWAACNIWRSGCGTEPPEDHVE